MHTEVPDLVLGKAIRSVLERTARKLGLQSIADLVNIVQALHNYPRTQLIPQGCVCVLRLSKELLEETVDLLGAYTDRGGVADTSSDHNESPVEVRPPGCILGLLVQPLRARVFKVLHCQAIAFRPDGDDRVRDS